MNEVAKQSWLCSGPAFAIPQLNEARSDDEDFEPEN